MIGIFFGVTFVGWGICLIIGGIFALMSKSK